MKLILFIYALALTVIPMEEGAYLKQLQPRDSILIADQLEYGFNLENVQEGTEFMFPDLSVLPQDTLALVRNWQLDTVKVVKKPKKDEGGEYNIAASVVLAPFEAGSYTLPGLSVQRKLAGNVDTLTFEPIEMEVKTIPIDTATFIFHDIKGQIKYPVTFKEIVPYAIAVIILAALIALAVYLIRKHKAKVSSATASNEPPHILALRQLEKYRGEKYWAPEKQKMLYSGITDTLRTYIESRFGVNAEEMTTSEIFSALKGSKDITPELFVEVKHLFETADFVKFAKYIAQDSENASAIPTAVRFVTSTYQSILDAEAGSGEEAEAK